MKKTIRNIVIILYAIIAIVVTIFLLSYNEYKVTELGTYSLVIIDNNKLEPDYEQGDLVIIDSEKEIAVGDKIFFYNTYEKAFPISLAEVVDKKIITETETTYTLEGDKPISSEYVMGPAKDAKTISKIGTVLSLLESQWGFLILIVLPAVIAFLYEVFEVIGEMRGKRRDNNDK